MTDGPTSAERPEAAPPKRRRKRDRLGFIAGVVTAASVVVAVLGLALCALFISGVIPLAGLQHYVAADLQSRLGAGWRVSAAKAAILRLEGQAVLQVRNAQFEHVSGLRLRAPEADVRYDPWSVAGGTLRIRSIDLHGVNLRLQADRNGAVTLDTGDATLPLAEADPTAPGVIERAGTAIATLLDSEALLPGLDRLSLTGARLTLVAPDGQERIGLESVSIHLERAEAGRKIRITGHSETGLKDLVLSSRMDEAGLRWIDASIEAFRLDMIERLYMGPAGAVLQGFPLSGKVSLGTIGGVTRKVSGALRLGAGVLRLPDAGTQPVALDRVSGEFEADGALSNVKLSNLRAEAGVTALSMQGQFLRPAGAGWTFTGNGSGLVAGEGLDPPQTVVEAGVELAGEGADSAELRAMTVKGPQLDVSATGRAARTPDGPEVQLRLNARNSKARALLAAWPRPISPIIRSLLVERLEAGHVEALALDVDMNAAALRMARIGDPTPDEAIKVEVSGKDVRFVIGEGIPKLHDLALSAVGTGRTLEVKASSARVEMAKNRQFVLTEGSFSIPDTWASRPIGRSAFRATGSVDALAALMALPAFRDSAPGQIDPEAIRGRFDLKTTVSLPLVQDVKATDVAVQSMGLITSLGSDTLIPNEKLEGGSLAANFDRGALTLRGELRLGGSPAQLDLRQDPRGVGEAIVTMTLDQAARVRRGFGFNGLVAGPVSVRMVKPLGRKPDLPPRLEADLTRAAIDGLLPGWNKPAGRPGKLSFTIVDDADGPDLNDFVLDAAPVLLRGRIELTKSGDIDAASMTAARLSPGDDMRIEVKRDGQVIKIQVRGQVADARPFLKPPGASGPGRKPDGMPDHDIDLAVPILTGFNNEVIGNAALKLSVRSRELRQLAFTGRIGRAPVSIQQIRDAEGRVIRLETEDGGAFLRYVDLYRRAYGGDLVIDGRPGPDESLTGDVLFRDFRVQGEPALRRVLGEQLVSQGPEALRGGRPRDLGSDVRFTKLKAGFTRTPGRFELRDGVIWGAEIGISAQGSIDYARDRADIAGTFVPGYALNNVFAQVPILGPLLGGGQYEGMFAVNFRVAGPASAPTMTINPLSAIAPGILRKFVDPLGGVPTGENAPARPARP